MNGWYKVETHIPGAGWVPVYNRSVNWQQAGKIKRRWKQEHPKAELRTRKVAD